MDSTIRQFLLQKQRNLEIQRCGVYVQYNKGQAFSFPCFAFDPLHTDTMKKYLSDNQPIIFYFPQNFTPVLNNVDQQQFYIESNGLFCKDRLSDQVFRHGFYYIAVKNNPTIVLLTRVLKNHADINPQIYNFINDPSYNLLSQNPKYKIQDWILKNLNGSQRQILNLVNNQKIAFIKGPPGCGKTKTIARIALFFARNQCPVLVGAVSNAANLTILNSLLFQGQQLNFLPDILLYINKESFEDNKKHPPKIRKLTYRYKLVQNYLKIDTSKSLTQQGVQFLIDKFFKNKNVDNKEHVANYYNAMALTFYKCNIVIATTTSSTKMDTGLPKSSQFKPYIGILDEAAQASWADACCFLIRNIEKMVFIGDENQLSPTVISNDVVLKQTMFTKLYMKNMRYFSLLNQQYRMHPDIFEFPNIHFYEGKIKNRVSQKQRESNVEYFIRYPLSFINCQSKQNQEIQAVSGKKNYWNLGEIKIIQRMLNLFAIQQYKNIGIISPYQEQINKIRQILPEEAFKYGLTIKTCDGYQGSQKQYIFFSCVRSNQQGKIGFCDEKNRLNVSITRAKRGLVLIGNKMTFLNLNKGSNIWHDYLEYLQGKDLIIEQKQIKKYQGIEQFPQIDGKKQMKRIEKIGEKNEVFMKIDEKMQQDLKIRQIQQKMGQKLDRKQIKIIEISQDDQQQVFKIYKSFKKKLKFLMIQLQNEYKQQQKNVIKNDIEYQIKQQQRNKIKNEIINLIKNSVKNQIENQQKQYFDFFSVKALPRQILFYEQLVKKNKIKSEQKNALQNDLYVQTENIIVQISKGQQMDRKNMENLMRCMDLSIAWCLFYYK